MERLPRITIVAFSYLIFELVNVDKNNLETRSKAPHE